MTPQSVIVTLNLDTGTTLGDYELPANLPIAQLGALLLDALMPQYSKLLSGWKGLRFSCGQSLNPDQTLAHCGIWDGSVVTLSRD